MMDADETGERELCFRTCRLLPAARVLLRNGRAVDLGGRAFDLLHILLASRGAIVSKAEIMSQVWPTTLVDEGNLRFQVSCLRRVLDEDGDLIKTIAGRGYLLAAEVTADEGQAHQSRVVAQALTGDRTSILLDEARATCEALNGLLRATLDELAQLRFQTARVGNPNLSARQLMRAVGVPRARMVGRPS